MKIIDHGSLLKWLAGRQLRLEGGFQVSTDNLNDSSFAINIKLQMYI